MSEERYITRRRLLSATSGVGSAMVGYPAVVAGSTGDSTGRASGSSAITKEELETSLAKMGLHLASGSSGTQSSAGNQPPEFVDDAKIYVGEYKNAQTPVGKPYAIETFEEFKNREAPPGFSSEDSQEPLAPTEVGPSALDEYIKRTTTINFEGIAKFEFGVGFGIKFSSDGTGVSANISVDIYVGSATITVSSFGVGVGIRDDGICLKDWSTKYYSVKVSGGVCLSITFTNDELNIGLSVDACADPCPVVNCPVCKGVSFSAISIDVPNIL